MNPKPSLKLLHLRTSIILGSIAQSRGAQADGCSEACTQDFHINSESLDSRPDSGTPSLIHIPAAIYTPSQIKAFAKWLFGPEGLPNLQILAGGDFSREGRYSEYNTLLCRPKSQCSDGYEELTPDNVPLWNIVYDNMDMLAACPYPDPL